MPRPPHRSPLAPSIPRRNRNDGPRKRRAGESGPCAVFNQNKKHGSEGKKSNGAQRCAGTVKCRRRPPTTFSSKSGRLLAADLVFLDQRGAGAKNGRNRQKQAASGRAETAADQAGKNRGSAAEHEANDVFVPAAVAERRRREADRRHVAPPARNSKPNDAISQTTSDTSVATTARSRARTRSWQTTAQYNASAIAPNIIVRLCIAA